MIQSELSSSGMLCTTHLTGEVAFEECSDHIGSFHSDKALECAGIAGHVVDCTDIHRFDITSQQIRTLFDLLASTVHRSSLRPTVVVAPKPYIYGMARMASAIAEGYGFAISVVRSRNELDEDFWRTPPEDWAEALWVGPEN